jgi:hypothetical protein
VCSPMRADDPFDRMSLKITKYFSRRRAVLSPFRDPVPQTRGFPAPSRLDRVAILRSGNGSPRRRSGTKVRGTKVRGDRPPGAASCGRCAQPDRTCASQHQETSGARWGSTRRRSAPSTPIRRRISTTSPIYLRHRAGPSRWRAPSIRPGRRTSRSAGGARRPAPRRPRPARRARRPESRALPQGRSASQRAARRA